MGETDRAIEAYVNGVLDHFLGQSPHGTLQEAIFALRFACREDGVPLTLVEAKVAECYKLRRWTDA